MLARVFNAAVDGDVRGGGCGNGPGGKLGWRTAGRANGRRVSYCLCMSKLVLHNGRKRLRNLL